jgi:hypothetical protein
LDSLWATYRSFGAVSVGLERETERDRFKEDMYMKGKKINTDQDHPERPKPYIHPSIHSFLSSLPTKYHK